MSGQAVVLTIVAGAVCTFFLRALPFLIFREEKGMPKWLERLGGRLPAAIMAVLIVYCLKEMRADPVYTGIPQILAAALVMLTYKWKHSTLFSIVFGTAGYMLLLQIIQRIG